MADTTLIRKTVVGATWMVAWRMVTRALGFASTLVLARILLPADFGILAMAGTFAACIDALSALGLQEALIRRPHEGRDLFDTAFTLQVIRSVVAGVALAISAPVVAWWFGDPRLVSVMFVLSAASAVSGLENIGTVEFRKEMRFDVQFLLNLVPRLLQIAVTIPLALTFHSFWALLAGNVIAKVVRLGMSYIVHPYRPKFQLAGWRELASFSFWSWATSAASLIWDRCDPFVIGPAFGAARLGVYLIALEVAILPVTELIAPAADALFAGFSVAQKQGTSSVRHAPLIATTILLGILPIIITISCASSQIVAILLGPKWVEAQSLVAILVWLCVFSPFSHIAGTVLMVHGYVRRYFIGNVLASIVKLAALATAVTLTRNLEIVAAVATVCVVAESAIFLVLLKGTGRIALREVVGPVIRMGIAAMTTMAVLNWVGLAWHDAGTSFRDNAAYVVAIGTISLTVFSLTDLFAWTLSGRPDGPEQRLLGVLRDAVPARWVA